MRALRSRAPAPLVPRLCAGRARVGSPDSGARHCMQQTAAGLISGSRGEEASVEPVKESLLARPEFKADPQAAARTVPARAGISGVSEGALSDRIARSLRIWGVLLTFLSGACWDTSASHDTAETGDYPEALVTYSSATDSSTEFAGAPLSSTLLRDGGALMVDSRELSFLRINPDGRVLWRGGRRGSGPGEFLEISQVLEADSGLFKIIDRASTRLTTLSKEGLLKSSMQVPWSSERNLHVIDVLANGEFLVIRRRLHRVADVAPTVGPDVVSLSQVTAEGVTTRSIGEVSVGDALFFLDAGVERAISLVNGSVYAQRCGSAVRIYGGGKSQSIDADGIVEQLPQPPGLRVPLAGGLVALVEQHVRSFRDQGVREELLKLVGVVGEPEVFQSKLVVPDRNGRLWMRAESRTSKGNYEAWDGDMKSDSLHISAPRFFIDSNGGLLLAVVPESAESLSSVELLRSPSSQTPAGEHREATHCSQSVRIPPP